MLIKYLTTAVGN